MTTIAREQALVHDFREVSIQDNKQKSHFPERIVGPSAWNGKELESKPEQWIYHFTSQDLEDIDQALQHFTSLNIPLVEITPDAFPLKSFKATMEKEKENLFKGRGFSLYRGLPVHKYSRKEQAAIFMGLGSYIGVRKPQNSKNHVLGHVKDLSQGSTTKVVYDMNDPTTRIYATRRAQPFHCDGSDIVGLLCLTHGVDGGESSLISSHTIYNRLQELRPDIVELMKESWLWDRKNEYGPNEPAYTDSYPITYYKDKLFTFWAPHFYETVTRFPGVVVEEEKFEAMRYIQELCERESLKMKLEVGDIQWVQNHQILHARSAYTDSPEATRHLLRLWLLGDSKETGWYLPVEVDQYNRPFAFNGTPTAPLEAE